MVMHLDIRAVSPHYKGAQMLAPVFSLLSCHKWGVLTCRPHSEGCGHEVLQVHALQTGADRPGARGYLNVCVVFM